VEVKRATAAFTAGGKEVPAGSYIISLAQPAKRLIRTLLDTDVPMSESFVKEQERRRSRKLPDEIYDVTGWSFPLQYNVEMLANAQVSTVRVGTRCGGRSAPEDLDKFRRHTDRIWRCAYVDVGSACWFTRGFPGKSRGA
jgi:hypothetical protein